MFSVIGMLAVTFIFGWIFLVFVSVNFIPAEFPIWLRILFMIFAVVMVIAWWFVVGVHIGITIN